MSPMHWLIVIGVLVLLFGAKKLPDMARSIGQSARVFKGEMKGLQDEESVPGAEPVVGEPKAVDVAAAEEVRADGASPRTRTAETTPTDSSR